MKMGDLVILHRPSYKYDNKSLTGIIVEVFGAFNVASTSIGDKTRSPVYKIMTSEGNVEIFLSEWVTPFRKN